MFDRIESSERERGERYEKMHDYVFELECPFDMIQL
jgi:hypothetical protein